MKIGLQLKNQFKRNTLLILSFLLLAFQNSFGAAGFFAQGSGGGLISYSANGGSQVNSYNWGSNLGALYSLTLNGGIIHTFKDGSGNVCGGTMFWRVYKVGNTPGSYNTVSLGFSSNGSFTTTATPSNISTSNGNDQRWLNSSANVNIFNDVNISSEVGSCRFDVYFEFTGNTSSSSGCGSTVSLGTSSSPLQLSFTKSRLSAGSGTFSTASNWSPVGVPSSNESLAIMGTNAITLDANYTASSILFASTGSLTVNTGQTLQLAGGVSGSGSFNVDGNLQINAGGFTNIAPTYGSSSTLIYNSGTTYGRGTEWSSTSGAGYPRNVLISGNTTLDLGANSGTNIARQCAGNLTINSGCSLTLANTAMTQALTVVGKLTNNGTVVLSGSSGGDLKLEGDLDDNGVFTANTRAIFFQGTNNQRVNSTTDPLDIDVMRVTKTAGEIILDQNLLVDETADPFQMTASGALINLNGKSMTIGKAGTASSINMVSGSAIKGSATSSLSLLGTSNTWTLRFDQTTPGTTNVLRSLTINRTSSGVVSLADALNIAPAGSLTVTAGTLNTGGALTLKSDASGTASILSSSGTISGNVTVERFIPRRRAFRFLASPINTSNFISGSWQQATHITGSLTGANGFDQSNSGTASLFTYNVSGTEGWAAIPNTNATNLNIGTGYRMLIRGDRNINLNTTTVQDSAALVLTATGSVVTGNVVFGAGSVSSSPAGIPALNAAVGSGANNSTIGWSLIGNPYACAVNWASVTKSNVSTTFATWNVNNAGRGSYVYHDGSAGTGSGASNIINSGQSIFVQTTAANPSITFTEASKVSSTPPSHFKKNPSNVLNLDIFIGDRAYDGLTVVFDENCDNQYDVQDFIKLVNPEINFYSYLNDGTKLAMNKMKEIGAETIVPLGLTGVFNGGAYEIKFSNQNTFANADVYLKDKFINKTYDLKSINNLTFTVTADSNSFGENRFELIFSKSATGI
ncbi:MAG: beta strand repeat-containing protein, partial [Bacteroidia bacterium]